MMALLTRAAGLAAALAVCAGPARAQNVERLPPARAEAGIYTGGSFTSDWFRTAERGWRPGYAPAFGAVGQYWFSTRLGVRLHGAYLPQNLPGDGGVDQRLRVVNSYLYDVDVAFRPFVLSTPNTLLQTVYLFAGGGGYTANTGDFMGPGDDGARCIEHPAWSPEGVCVSTRPGYATSAMGTAGGGIRLGPVTRRVEAFGELAVHAYASPGHVRAAATGEDRLSWTPRAAFGLRTPLADAHRAAPSDAPAPFPPRPVPQPPETAAPLPAEPARIVLCRVSGGEALRLDAAPDPATGDTTVRGTPLRTAHPADAGALGTDWYADGAPLVLDGRRYVKFGLPRTLEPGSVRRVGEFRGVGVFAGAEGAAGTVYVPLGSGCDFQAYVAESKVGAVRG
jgi:hypothetical protein